MENIEYIKGKLEIAFFDKDGFIRKTVASLISTIIVKGGFHVWTKIFDFLVPNLQSEDESIVENSMDTISIIIEDSSKLFEEDNYSKYLE
jgi:hypothetical protein